MQGTKTALFASQYGRFDSFIIRTCTLDLSNNRFCILSSAIVDLEEKLRSSNARIKLIATDGVFSMDGNVAPLDQICDLADKYDALTFVDDCHATGFFGNTGRLLLHIYNYLINVLKRKLLYSI